MAGATPFFPEVTAAWQAAAKAMEGSEITADPFLEAASKFVPLFRVRMAIRWRPCIGVLIVDAACAELLTVCLMLSPIHCCNTAESSADGSESCRRCIMPNRWKTWIPVHTLHTDGSYHHTTAFSHTRPGLLELAELQFKKFLKRTEVFE